MNVVLEKVGVANACRVLRKDFLALLQGLVEVEVQLLVRG